MVRNLKDKDILVLNLDKLHLTELGYFRVINNLNLDKTTDVVEYCKNLILEEESLVYKANKNYYIELNNIRLTINANTYNIITAHFKF